MAEGLWALSRSSGSGARGWALLEGPSPLVLSSGFQWSILSSQWSLCLLSEDRGACLYHRMLLQGLAVESPESEKTVEGPVATSAQRKELSVSLTEQMSLPSRAVPMLNQELKQKR